MIHTEPVIMDIEASGFGFDSYPIEVGIALENNSRYCSLISPANDWTHWEASAEAVHHIDRELLIKHGKHTREVAEDLNKLLAGKTVYTDGWVVDKPWLLKLFDQSMTRPTFHISALELILSEEQIAIWHETKNNLINELKITRHRASNDAYIVQQTWLKTKSLALN